MEGKTRVSLNYLDMLVKFHSQYGNELLEAPDIFGIPVDLHSIKASVDELGGFYNVTVCNLWMSIAQSLSFASEMASMKLRDFYIELIVPFELFLENGNSEKHLATKNFVKLMQSMKVPSRKSRYQVEDSDSEDDSKGASKQLFDANLSEAAAKKLQSIYSRIMKKFNAKEKPKNYEKGNFCELCFGTVSGRNDFCVCYKCDKAFHDDCIIPSMSDIDKAGPWYCPECIVVKDDYSFENGRKYNLLEFKQVADAFKKKHFNRDTVSELECEKEFWRLATSTYERVEVEYGADLHTAVNGSGFPSPRSKSEYSKHRWNLNNFANVNGSLLKFIDREVDGMKVPWLYVGMCFSTFCWHTEDHHTYSINYHHGGETKTWYGIPHDNADKFEEIMKKHCPELFEAQPDLLFHITTTLSPKRLQDEGVAVSTVHQRKGEFVVTFPQAYHAGFNQGFNVAEAVNFALPDWLPLGLSCARRYKLHKKLPVFSMEHLIFSVYSAKLNGYNLQIKEDEICFLIRSICENELQQRKFMSIIFPKIRTKTARKSRVLSQDEVRCRCCNAFCYLSFVTCSCSKQERILCIEAYSELDCKCTTEQLTLYQTFSNQELFTLAMGDYSALKEFQLNSPQKRKSNSTIPISPYRMKIKK